MPVRAESYPASSSSSSAAPPMSLRMASIPSSFFSTLTCVGDAYGARRGERRRMRGGDVATRLDVEHVYRHANDATRASWADRGDLPQDARGEKHDGDS